MTDEKWPRTSRAIADSEQAASVGDYDLTDDGPEPERGMSLLHELANEPENGIREYEPGRFYVSKLRPDRDKLS